MADAIVVSAYSCPVLSNCTVNCTVLSTVSFSTVCAPATFHRFCWKCFNFQRKCSTWSESTILATPNSCINGVRENIKISALRKRTSKRKQIRTGKSFSKRTFWPRVIVIILTGKHTKLLAIIVVGAPCNIVINTNHKQVDGFVGRGRQCESRQTRVVMSK
jgi:hypothetical protein